MLALAVACGGGSNEPGPYPWLTADLMPVGCESEGFDCFIMIVKAEGEGSDHGSCRVRAMDVEFTALSDNESETAFETEQFTFVSGQELRFPVEVPQVDDERFLYWSADCTPGRRA